VFCLFGGVWSWWTDLVFIMPEPVLFVDPLDSASVYKVWYIVTSTCMIVVLHEWERLDGTLCMK
jgi:hypothetical protein